MAAFNYTIETHKQTDIWTKGQGLQQYPSAIGAMSENDRLWKKSGHIIDLDNPIYQGMFTLIAL